MIIRAAFRQWTCIHLTRSPTPTPIAPYNLCDLIISASRIPKINIGSNPRLFGSRIPVPTGSNPTTKAEPSHASETDKARDGLHLLIHIDHQKCQIYRSLGRGDKAEKLVPHKTAYQFTHHLHNKRLDVHQHGSNKFPKDFVHDVEQVIDSSDQTILVGHGTGKSSMVDMLYHHVEEKKPNLLKKIVARYHIDEHDVSEAKLLKLARELFHDHADPRQPRTR